RESACPGNVQKCSFPGVAIETVLANAGDVYVRETVVVVVANGHTHPVHLNVEPGLFRHVGECSITVVAEEAKGGTLAMMSGPIGAVDEKDVLPPVGIVVEECAA